MKKLICVMTLVCIGILLVSCGSKRLDNPKAQFIRDFGLNIEKEDCVLEELFNNCVNDWLFVNGKFLVCHNCFCFSKSRIEQCNIFCAVSCQIHCFCFSNDFF